MSKLIEELRLIMVEADTNNNKFWTGQLYEDDTVITKWGRVGYAGDTKTFPGKGKKFLEQKRKEKEKKGYSEVQTLAASAPGKIVDVTQTKLHEAAKKDIAGGDPIVVSLIERLVKANVHKITSNTQITFDPTAGTFSTPLGIVTLDAINDARNLLNLIQTNVQRKEFTSTFMAQNVSRYLRLIPQNVGMKLLVERLFPDDTAIAKQSDLLDSLEASYKASIKAPVSSVFHPSDEKVFSVKLLPADGKEIDRIRKIFKDTKHGYHASSVLDVKQAFLVDMESLREAFIAGGMKIGNIMELWHGTRSANLLSILKSGLRLSPPNTAAISGKMFGNGIYFSDQSTKSLNYAFGYWGGNRDTNCFMFLSDVAMGNAFTPRNSTGSNWTPPAGHHSCFAKAGQSGVMNNEMIVYRENQYNLTRLVEFSPNGK